MSTASRVVCGVWWLVLAGCAPTSRPAIPPPSPSVPASSPSVPSNPLPDGGQEIPWSADRSLSWEDFRGVAPVDGVEGARTVYLLSYEWRCRGTDFTFGVRAVVLPQRSWVKPHVLASPAESRRVLGHEQTHFNLTETYARRMRKFLKELYNPCGILEEQMRESVERFVRDEGEAQRRYDDETGYGLKPQPQARWDRDVAESLGNLAAFQP